MGRNPFKEASQIYLENYTVWAEQVIGALTEAWQGPAA